MGLIAWLLGSSSIVGAATTVLKSAGSIAGSVADGWAAKQKAMTDQHGMDVKAATEITVEGFKADVRFAELEATAALADRQDKRTSWIRPAYTIPAIFWFFCLVLEHTLPGVAHFIGIQVTALPTPFDWLAVGIPAALFALRPIEKNTKANTVAKAQATIASASPGRTTFSQSDSRSGGA